MTNPMINPQPNYSGVTIQISNPAVNVGSGVNGAPYGVNQQPQAYGITNGCGYNNYLQQPPVGQNIPQEQAYATNPNQYGSYPPQYYLNNYNYQYNNPNEKQAQPQPQADEAANIQPTAIQEETQPAVADMTPEKMGLKASNNEDAAVEKEEDLSKSQNIIDELNTKQEAQKAEEQNSKKKRVVALTDEYIKSLENYLNNPNQEIRLMASKEILTRLDEDKDRFDDAALNALLNKMLQDPSKLIRIASLSAFNSQLASGNEYTLYLLRNIQQNPSADKEDVLQAADILLKMSAGTEVKYIPNPAVKEDTENKG